MKTYFHIYIYMYIEDVCHHLLRVDSRRCLITEQSAPAPHIAHPEGCVSLRILLVPVPRVRSSREHFPDGFDLHLQQAPGVVCGGWALKMYRGNSPMRRATQLGP